MIYLNYAVCVAALICIIAEIYLILKRNKKVRQKGSDDFFTFSLILMFVVIIFPIDQNALLISALRNSLLILVLLCSLAVKRGLADEGVMKLGYVIPWSDLEKITVDEYQTSKIMVTFYTEKRHVKLFFNKYRLREILIEMEKHVDRKKILMKESLDSVLKMKKR